MPFTAMVNFVRSNLKEKFHLLVFGTTSQYLLVADMCELGLVVKPTVAEMGATIYCLNTGSVQSLLELGYLERLSSKLSKQSTQHRHSCSEVVEAFTAFYEDVNTTLSTSEKQRMGWGSITAEHSLCKMKWMLKKGFYAAMAEQ